MPRGALAYPLAGLAEVDFRTGRWTAACVNAAEAARLADETGQLSALALIILARIEAAQGRESECRAHAAATLTFIDEHGLDGLRTHVGAALGLLALGLGRFGDAVEQLTSVARVADEQGIREPSIVQWPPDLIEALIHCGRQNEATQALRRFEQQAARTQRNWALATAARCRGLLVAPDHREREFREALALHDRLGTPFERARTELCLGEHLRRRGDRIKARRWLRSAMAEFQRLGAVPWAERARAELRASGETMPHRHDLTAADTLSPHELRVALLIAEGTTNREAAAQLFLTPKTIEFHLGHIYRKLHVRSRTELAGLLLRDPSLA